MRVSHHVNSSEPEDLLLPRVEIFTGFRADGRAGRAELEVRARSAGRFGHAVFAENIERCRVDAFGGGLSGLKGFDYVGVFNGFVTAAFAERYELLVVAEHLEQLDDALAVELDRRDTTLVHGFSYVFHGGVALVVHRVRDEGAFRGFAVDFGFAGGSLDTLGAASALTIDGHFVPALSADGVLDEACHGVDEVGVENAICEPGASGNVLVWCQAGQHIHLPVGGSDIVNAFDVVFAFERFQAAVED